ncbi:MAG: TonB-dependent receptor [Prevotella sp.]|jgi:TonB-linked SusC/RagA family outer membrane protein|nr:TonB-dependent receptor [Prevotella sp.]
MRKILFLLLLVVAPCIIYAQSYQISGKVTDAADRSPIPGVTVQTQAKVGVMTDADGNYTIRANKGDILTFSFIGMIAQSVKVESSNNIDVALKEDNVALEEVVVVGYGTVKKKDLTGSVTSMAGDKLKEIPVATFDQAMQGKLSGVQITSNSGTPGAPTTIRIRGITSINGGNEPLYVIDGVPQGGEGGTIAGFDWAGGANGQNVTNPLAGISPSDIISIDVLKDASATAIYGAAGANGVIMVTTRRGKAGDIKINYDGFSSVSSIPKTLDMMNLREYALYQQELSADLGNTLSDYFKDPSILGKGQNWQDAVFRDAWAQSHNVTVSGGSDKLQFSASAGWFDQDGVVIGSGFNRFNSRFNFDAQAKKWLKLGGSLVYSRTNETITLNDGGDGVIMTALMMGPNVPVYDIDGNFAGPESVEGVSWNPVAIAMQRNNKLLRNNYSGSFYASADIIKGLTLRAEYSFSGSNNTNKAFHPTYQWGALKNDISRIMKRDDQSYYWINTDYLTWTKDFGQHNIVAMAGFEAIGNTWEGSQLIKSNLTSNDIQVIGVDGIYESNSGWKGKSTQASLFGRANYNYASKYYLTATIRRDGSSKFGADNKWGTFPSLAAAWRISGESFLEDNKTISNLKLRIGYGMVGNSKIDNFLYGSSMTAATTPLGTGYRVSRISNPSLKWESSVQYNAGIDLGLLNGRLDLTVDAYYKTTKDLLMQLSIPSYLGGSDWSDIQSPWGNIGKIDNKGIDITLNAHIIKSNNLNWNSNVVFSLNRNKVKELNAENQAFYGKLDWYSEFQTATITKVGYPIGVFYGYKTEGLFKDKEDILNHSVQKADPTNSKINYVNKTGGVWVGDVKFVDLNDDGKIDTDDQTIIGNPNPDFTFGFNNNFSYKDFDFGFSFIGSIGGDILNYAKSRIEGQTSIWNNQSVTVNDRARIGLHNEDGSPSDPDNVYLVNPDATVPRATTNDVNRNNRMSDRFIEDGSYVRLSNISLGYTIPAKLTAKWGVTKLRVYISAQNLLTITGYSGYDPEIGAYNQDSQRQNIDMGHYPSPRTFMFGLNLGF